MICNFCNIFTNFLFIISWIKFVFFKTLKIIILSINFKDLNLIKKLLKQFCNGISNLRTKFELSKLIFLLFFLGKILNQVVYLATKNLRNFNFAYIFSISNFYQKRIKSHFVKNFPKNFFKIFSLNIYLLKILWSGVLSV